MSNCGGCDGCGGVLPSCKDNVILFGMKHCGKSTVGSRLADRLGCALFDLDDLMEVAYEAEHGEFRSVRDIFRSRGEEFFEKLEGRVAVELLNLLDTLGERAVIAVGGRSVLHERTRHVLTHMGLKVYLQLPQDELYRRVMAGGRPPFLDEQDPRASFDALFQSRKPHYESFAELTVDLADLAPADAVDRVEQAIEEYRHARQ